MMFKLVILSLVFKIIMLCMAKKKVIYDLEEFPLKNNDGGLYSIFPYEILDKHHKGLFKVGLTDSFDKRFEQYHTSYPYQKLISIT